MEGLCPCGHEPTGSIVPVSYLVSYYTLKFHLIILNLKSVVKIYCGGCDASLSIRLRLVSILKESSSGLSSTRCSVERLVCKVVIEASNSVSGSLIWPKTLKELILTPVMNFGEVRRAQLAKSTLHAGVPGIFSDLVRSLQMLERVGRG